MSEVIERAARAIRECIPDTPDFGDIERAARAAIEAMREPTSAMLDVGAPYPAHLVVERDDPIYTARMKAATLADQFAVAMKWRNMIDAALKP
jgi:hypothetical protein